MNKNMEVQLLEGKRNKQVRITIFLLLKLMVRMPECLGVHSKIVMHQLV